MKFLHSKFHVPMPTTCYAYIEYSATWAPALPAVVPIGPLRAGRALNVDAPKFGNSRQCHPAQVTVSAVALIGHCQSHTTLSHRLSQD
jgi:hypothetical protein